MLARLSLMVLGFGVAMMAMPSANVLAEEGYLVAAQQEGMHKLERRQSEKDLKKKSRKWDPSERRGSVRERPGDVMERKGSVRERPGDVMERKGSVRERPGDVMERRGSVQERPGNVMEHPGGQVME